MSSAATSSLDAGLALRKPFTIGGRISRATIVGTLSRSVPVGLSRKLFTASTRGLDLAERGRESFQETCTGLGRRHAARRAIEEPHAEAGFEPANRLAQGRGGNAAHDRRAAKAAVACDRRRRRPDQQDRGQPLFEILHNSDEPMPDYRTQR